MHEVDWERVSKALRVAALFAVRGAPPAFDCGVSAEDLVNETLAAFFLDPNCLGWELIARRTDADANRKMRLGEQGTSGEHHQKQFRFHEMFLFPPPLRARGLPYSR